jgi:hypothetical protein
MKDERSLLQDVIGTVQPNEKNKTKKYLRIAITSIILYTNHTD